MYRHDTLYSPVNRSQIIKKIPGPNFEKMVPRDHEQVRSMNGSIDYQDTSLSILQQKHQQSSRFQ